MTKKAMLFGTMLLASAIAHAQFAWIDEKGVRHYSDQPPPTSTPDAKILKLPRGMQRPADAPASTAAGTTAAAPKAAPTLAEREADYRKRHADAEASDKKASAEKDKADAKRAQCDAAMRVKAQLETGRRLRTEQNVPMTEEEKAREMATADKTLKDCK